MSWWLVRWEVWSLVVGDLVAVMGLIGWGEGTRDEVVGAVWAVGAGRRGGDDC